MQDDDAYNLYPHHRKWFNKLYVAELFGYDCGPAGVAPTKDGTYVDCLTNEFAVEAEYDYKWKEGIGQALHYAESTNKMAAILFIKRNESNKDYLLELNRVIERFELPIKIFVVQE